MTMHVLVSGASGTVGARLVRGLVARGHEVRALVLPGDPFLSRLEGTGCEIVSGDITRSDSLAGVFDGIDTVYHLAAVILSRDPEVYKRVNVGGTRAMLAGAGEAGVGHFIYISSASVVYPRSTPYSRSKRECERLVSANGRMRYTIVRPTLVYDKDGGQEFALFLNYLMKFPVVPFIGRGRALKNPVYLEDLMAGLLKLAGCRAAYGKTYAFCGGEEISILDLARLMLSQRGESRPLVPLPVPVCRLAARALQSLAKGHPFGPSAIAGITQDANLDCSSAREDLGYDPIGVHEGFKRCFG